MTSERKLEQATKGPVRLTFPISVAYDLNKFEQALTNLAHTMDRLNVSHREPCLYMREFIVDSASLQVREGVAEL